MRELTWPERHFVAFVLGSIPACIIGLFVGLWGSGIGGREFDLGTVLLKGAYCAVFPVLLACFMPRCWILPTLSYLVGFSVSFGISDRFAGLVKFALASAHWIEAKPMIIPQPLSHADMPWVFGIALWLAGLTGALRRSTWFATWLRRLEIRE